MKTKRQPKSTKLTKKQVAEIRQLLEAKMQIKRIAARFGVNPKTISNIKHRRTWDTPVQEPEP